MRYRTLANDQQQQDYYAIASATIPPYVPKAAWLQRLFVQNVFLSLAVVLIFATVLLWTHMTLLAIVPALVLVALCGWLVYANKFASTIYHDQALLDMYFVLPKHVQRQLKPVLKAHRHFIEDDQINQRTAELIRQYADFYDVRTPEQRHRQSLLELINQQLTQLDIIKKEFTKININ